MSINAQQTKNTNKVFCDFGITFEISNNPGWGYGEPVITTVQPYSLADKAGLKVGDIIMEVNSAATYLRDLQTISNWLSDDSDPEIRLTIRNVDTYFREYPIYRECKSANSMSEFRLASAYSFYSLMSTSQRAFSIPMRVDPNLDVDFTDYHTFDFLDEGADVPAMDAYINQQLEKALIARGLKRNKENPDMIVQSYYTFQPNIKYDPKTYSQNTKTWRYDTNTQEMIILPILSGEDPNAEIKGRYIIELGVRFFDKRFINENKLTQIWDARTRDYLTEEMTIQEYTTIHAPLLLMQYPYSTPKSIAKYLVSFKAFNYTGLNFDANDMKTITYVDNNSPAQIAGIKPGDVIEKINGFKFDYTPAQLEIGYRRFLIETMQYRNKKTRFIDANGFPDCMYWEKSKYPEINAAFQQQALYTPIFSYLYSFEKYVPRASPSGDVLVDAITRNGQKKYVSIKPQLQSSVVVRAL